MTQLGYIVPTVCIEELDRSTRLIDWVSTMSDTVAGFIGFSEDIRNGAELSKPMLVKSWVQYLEYFAKPNSDGFTDFDAYLPFAVYGYFLNGGSRCWITSIGTRLPEQLADRSQPVQKQQPSALVIPECNGLPCLNLLLRPEKAADGPIQIVVSDSARVPPPASFLDKYTNREFFTLLLKRQGEVLEQYEHLTMHPCERDQTATYVVEALESSKYVVIQDINQFKIREVAILKPRVVPIVSERPLNGEYELYPFLPTASSERFAQEVEGDYDLGTGVRGVIEIDEIAMVAFPDLMRAYKAGILNLDRVYVIMELILSKCEAYINNGTSFGGFRSGKVMLDSRPHRVDPEVNYFNSRYQYDNFYHAFEINKYIKLDCHSMFATLYYPWIEVPNPRNIERPILVPPCGHMMGLWARTERGCMAYEASTNVSVVQLVRYIQKSIELGTQWVAFKPNSEILWVKVQRTVSNFLEWLWQEGALFGKIPEEAFYVKCDGENNTPNSIKSGHLYIDVGVAPVRPSEFIVFRVSQDSGTSPS